MYKYSLNRVEQKSQDTYQGFLFKISYIKI